jgi:serine/threonine-protein kinase
MANLVGQSLGKYQITELLGKGGMAEVYKAYHPDLDRNVTVKILHSYLAEGEGFLARFKREAKAVASLRHAHIVQIHDFEVRDDIYYMVMEYVEGGTLQSKMAALAKSGKRMASGQILSILRQVAEALDYAHKSGIIHRDIKPSNILLDPTDAAYLTDFGIARMISTTQFTTTGALIGTPTYMSPEQALGEEALTSASDIYSLGIILYELFTGKAPFAAETTPLAVIHKHIHEPPPKPRSIRADLPEAVEEVILKTLAKDPKERYPNALSIVQALENVTDDGEQVLQEDASAAEETARAAMPTEKMSVEELPTVVKAKAATEVMEPETSTKIKAEAAVEAPTSGTRKPTPEKTKTGAAGKSRPQMTSTPAKRGAQPRATSIPLVKRLTANPILLGGIGLAVVVVLVLIFSAIFTGASCGSIQSCTSQAWELWEQGNRDEALANWDAAIEMVHPDDHAEYAWLWCDRATMMDELGDPDEAMRNRQVCEAWEMGE